MLKRIQFLAYFCSALGLALCWHSLGLAEELRELYRSDRATAMGGASVAIVDGHESIWLNPAGLGGTDVKEVHYLNPLMEFSGDTYFAYLNNTDVFDTTDLNNMNQLLGYNSYLRGQVTPTIVMPNFGFSLLSDFQGAFYARNQTLPQITLGYQNTNGIQLAFGFSTNRRKGSLRYRRNSLHWGFALKAIWRRGGFFELTQLDLLKLTEGKTYLSQVIGNYQLGIGADAGAQYIIPMSRRTSLNFGLAFLNIGNVGFSGKAQAIENNLAIGLGWKYRVGFFNFDFAYDYRNILQDVDWRLKNHFGMEVGIKRFAIQLGINQAFLTYGMNFDIWFFRMSILSYAQELGTNVRQDPNRRYVLKFDMKFNL